VLIWIILALLFMSVLSACGNLAAMAPPTLSPQAAQGRAQFEKYCSRCHGTVGDTIIVGPSLAGVASRAGNRIAGMDAQAYIRSSIEEPGAYTVEGFPEGIMPPNFKEQIPPENLDMIVAYLLTLK